MSPRCSKSGMRNQTYYVLFSVVTDYFGAMKPSRELRKTFHDSSELRNYAAVLVLPRCQIVAIPAFFMISPVF
ncbi:hypothetical protein T03_13553 [Trichinella britovi]|uniref:Uncharacterized protein n=1 Tax=Trichinella britovi TaxID=45882 RepID=A0A0V1C8H8_TRIBR|nr:hypothetical protein T03_13553 [Trichinella britovi]